MKLRSYAAQTHQGPYLQINEDDIDIDLINKLYLVFDGFGGSGIGDKVVNNVKNNIKSFFTRFGGDPDSTLPFFYSQKYLLETNALINAILYTNDTLMKENIKLEMNQRGGASCISAVESENILSLIGTGNCSGYLYRKGHLKEVLSPDNMELLAHDSFQRYFSSVPMSGFGLFPDLHYKVSEVRVIPGDMILLLTDGVYARLTKDELKSILNSNVPTTSEMVKEMFKLANSRGNLDNQSSILLHY